MAYKIIYGAGKTLERGGGFNTGYGFLAMHRDEAVQKFAYRELEPRILGRSYHFDRGPHWKSEEMTVISSFQRHDGWYVLSRLRPTSERNGSIYFLAEFLLLDEREARELGVPDPAPGSGETPPCPAVVPAEILACSPGGVWHNGPCWNREPEWIESPISIDSLRAEVSERYLKYPDFKFPVYRAFSGPQSLWRFHRQYDWRPEDALLSMAATQHCFMRHYGDRLPDGGGLFELAWNRISLTSFYLDPDAGLDLRFPGNNEIADRLPYTWTAVFDGAQYHDRLLEAHPDLVVEVDGSAETEATDPTALLGSKDSLIAAGWIRQRSLPSPDAPKPEMGAATNPSASQPNSTSLKPTTKPGSAKRGKGRGKPSSKNSSALGWIGGVVGLALLIFFAVYKFGVHAPRQRAVDAALMEMKTTRESGSLGMLEQIIRESEVATKVRDERFGPYLAADVHARAFRDYLKSVGNADPKVAIPLPNELQKPGFFPDLDELTHFAEFNASLLRKRSGTRRNEELEQLGKLLAEWRKKGQTISASFERLGWDIAIWKNYEKAVAERVELRLENLIATEEAIEAPGAEDESFRTDLLELVQTNSGVRPAGGEIARALASFLPQVTALGKPDPSTSPVAGGSSASDAPSRAGTEMDLPAPAGVVARGRFVWPLEPTYYELPKDGFSEHRLIPEEAFTEMLANARWSKGLLSLPLPRVESVEGLVSFRIGTGTVTAGDQTIGLIHPQSDKPNLFRFPDSTDPSPTRVILALAKNEDGSYECWIYLRETVSAPTTAETLLRGTEETEASVAGVETLKVRLGAAHPLLGEEMRKLVPQPKWAGDPSALGAALVTAFGIEGKKAENQARARLRAEATVFQNWFGGGDGAPTLNSTFFKDAYRWTEENEKVSEGDQAIIRSSISDQPIWDLLGKGAAIEHEGQLLKTRLAYFLAIMGKLATESLNSVETENPVFYLHKGDPFHKLCDLPKPYQVEEVREILKESIRSYQLEQRRPAPSTEEEKPDEKEAEKETPEKEAQRLRTEFRTANGRAMKQNWERFNKDLDAITKFVDAVDGASKGPRDPRGRVDYVLAGIKEAERKVAELDALAKRLKKGDLSEVELNIEIGPDDE